MLSVLSKIKHECYKSGIELLNSEISNNAIKLSCCVNGSRATELNAYIIPDGDSFNFYTMTPTGDKSPEVKVKEEEILPTLISAVNPNKNPMEVEGKEVTETTEDLVDDVKIEVEDGVFDTKVVPHDTYKNSRFAYSLKYNKMGTIVEVKSRKK